MRIFDENGDYIGSVDEAEVRKLLYPEGRISSGEFDDGIEETKNERRKKKILATTLLGGNLTARIAEIIKDHGNSAMIFVPTRVENFITKHGQEAYDRAVDAAQKSGMPLADVLDLTDQFTEDHKIQIEIDQLSLLSYRKVGFPENVIKEDRDRIPVPKSYKRNRFKK